MVIPPFKLPEQPVPDLARRAGLLAMAGAAIGGIGGCDARQPAPQFQFTLLDGQRESSQALRGKVVLVNFWATSCAPCVEEMPALVATYRRYHRRGLETLAVAMRYDPPAAVSDFAERRALPFGVVIDIDGAIARSFADLQATPTTYLIDRRGAIARRYIGRPDFADLQAQVEQLLAESPGAA